MKLNDVYLGGTFASLSDFPPVYLMLAVVSLFYTLAVILLVQNLILNL